MNAILLIPLLHVNPVRHTKQLWVEEDNAQHSNLVKSMEEDILPHHRCDHQRMSFHGESMQQVIARRFSRKSERRESVHNEIHPEHLDGIQRRFTENHTAHECHEHSDDVDGYLELQELSNAVEDVASPLNCGDRAGEVIVD